MNILYYGDNLEILREYIPDESVEDYFAGKRPDMPDVSAILKEAKRIKKDYEEKPRLGIR